MSRSSKWKTFLKKLNNPPNWIATLAFATTLIVCPLALAMTITDYAHTVYAILGYIISGIVFIYTIYIAVVSVRKLYRRLEEVADKYTFTRNLHKNYEFRSIFLGICTLVFNVGYTVFLCVMAIDLDSAWYGALALYHILLILTRGGILLQNSKYEKQYGENPLGLQKAKVGIYNYCGYMLLALAAALLISVIQMVTDSGFHMPDWAVYAFAAVALWRVIMAIVNFVRATIYDDLVVRAVRYINLSAALVSVLTLETAVFGAFSLGFNRTVVNSVTGGLVCAITVIIGVYTLISSSRIKKRLRLQETQAGRALLQKSGYNRDGYREEYGQSAGARETEFPTEENSEEEIAEKMRVWFDRPNRRDK